jgi:hypothetical protein
MDTTLEYVRAQLDRRASEKQLVLVAAGASVSLRTLQNIRAGKGAQFGTVAKLDDYLKRTTRRKRLDEVGV